MTLPGFLLWYIVNVVRTGLLRNETTPGSSSAKKMKKQDHKMGIFVIRGS